MRTTLTIDDDVAVRLERMRGERGTSLKALVNQMLRDGIANAGRPRAARVPYRTPSANLGRCLVGNLDNVADVLAVAEGEDFR